MAVETSILIPTLDDASTLGETIERLNRLVAATGAAAEVVVVDAGSQDGTLELAAELADRFPLLHMRILVQDRAHAGFGSVVRLGVAYAEGRFIVTDPTTLTIDVRRGPAVTIRFDGLAPAGPMRLAISPIL